MSEWYEIDASWDANGYASDALLKLGETREWSDLVDEVAKLTHATAEEAWDGMAAAVRGYLESLDGQDVTDDIGRVTESPEMLHDTREKLEADVREEVGHYFAWQEKRDQFADKIVEWLDRQAAITGREWMAYREVLVHENCDQAECITELTAKLADARESLEAAWKDNAELGDQVDELKAKLDAEAQHAREAWRLWGEADVKLERMTAERDHWKDAFEDSERMRLELIEQVEY